MPLRLVRGGTRFNVYAYAPNLESSAPVVLWIRGLDDQHRKTFLNLIERTASHGQIHNVEKSRDLGDGIYEFKSHHGAGERLAYFYLPGGRVVLSHGFPKGDPVRTQILRATSLRARVLQESQ